MTVFDAIRGGIVVSCQAYPGEPLRRPGMMALMAAAAALGGAVGIRAQGLDDIREIHETVALPQMGLVKRGDAGVFITPTLQDALEVAAAGAEIVAIDGTRRPRPDGLTLEQTIRRFREQSGALVLADCGSLDDALAAVDAGVDAVASTLAGYTGEREKTDGPDLELVTAMASQITLPVIAEGRIHDSAAAVRALDAGAHCVVVGTAITHPSSITSWFVSAARGWNERT